MNPVEMLQQAIHLLQEYVRVEPDPADRQRVAACVAEISAVARKDTGEGEAQPAAPSPRPAPSPFAQSGPPSPLQLAAAGRQPGGMR